MSAAGSKPVGRFDLEALSDGELVDPKDPIVKGREALFTPVQVTFPTVAPVEQATAEPGARRSVRRAKAVDDG